MTTDEQPPPLRRAPASPARGPARLPSPAFVAPVILAARLMTIVGILTFLLAAVGLLFHAATETWRMAGELVAPEGAAMTSQQLILGSIKLIDLVLIATTLQLVAVGLYSLFIDSTIPLPDWLRIEGIDDLKRKLIVMVIIVLAVLFLEQVTTWGTDRNVLPLGAAIALVILALSLFLLVQPGSDRPSSAD